jgi:hypothetical protein
MYTIGAFRKKNEEPEAEAEAEAEPEPIPKQKIRVEVNIPIPVIPQKKDWVILTKKNIVDDEKSEDIKKDVLLRLIRHNDREIILKKAYLEYMLENEDYMRSIYEKITTLNPVYFDKLRSSEKGFIIFSRFVFSKYIFDKNNLKGLRDLL